MAFKPVYEHFEKVGLANRITVFERATRDVAEAATWLDIPIGAVAKSIVFDLGDRLIMVVLSCDDKIDAQKFKKRFGMEPHLLEDDRVPQEVGHVVGGVCPFDLPDNIDVYLDMTLRRYPRVYPAAGSRESAIGLTPDELSEHSKAKQWIYLAFGSDEFGR